MAYNDKNIGNDSGQRLSCFLPAKTNGFTAKALPLVSLFFHPLFAPLFIARNRIDTAESKGNWGRDNKSNGAGFSDFPQKRRQKKINQETFELTSWETCGRCRRRLPHVQTAVQINFVGPKNLARISSRFPTRRRNPLFRVKRRGKYFLFLSSLLNGDGDCQLSLERRGRKRTYFPDFFLRFFL